MKSDNKKSLSDKEKLDYLITKIDQIEKQLNPPFWKKFIGWFFANLWTFLFLALIGYFLWQLWGIIQGVQENIRGFEVQFVDFKTTIESQVQKFSDQASSLNLDKIKFWE